MPINNISVTYNPQSGIRHFLLTNHQQQIHINYGLWICYAMADQLGCQRDNITARRFEFYAISHLLTGHGYLWQKNKKMQFYKPGQAVMMTPEFVHDYGGRGVDYHEDTICFCGPVADQLFQSGIIKPGVFEFGSVRKLLPIIETANDPAKDAQIKANIALQSLLTDLYFQRKKSCRKGNDLVIEQVIEEIVKNPAKNWCIDELAVMCHLSYNHFRRLFKHFTGMNPKLYIDKLKMNMAIQQLIQSDDVVSVIAHNVGFEDPFHFSRRFKDIIGISPENYRKSHKNELMM